MLGDWSWVPSRRLTSTGHPFTLTISSVVRRPFACPPRRRPQMYRARGYRRAMQQRPWQQWLEGRPNPLVLMMRRLPASASSNCSSSNAPDTYGVAPAE